MGSNAPQRSMFGEFELKHPHKVFGDDSKFKEVAQFLWLKEPVTKEQLSLMNSAAVKVDDCLGAEQVLDEDMIAQGIRIAVIFDKELPRSTVRSRIELLMELCEEKKRLSPEEKALMVSNAVIVYGAIERRDEHYEELRSHTRRS